MATHERLELFGEITQWCRVEIADVLPGPGPATQ